MKKKKPASTKLQTMYSSKKPVFLKKTDKRYARHMKQLKTRGFSDSETWSLYSVIVGFVLPRLIRFKQIRPGYPMGMTDKEWNDILDKMIFAFQWIKDDGSEEYYKLSTKQLDDGHKKCQEGLKLFGEYFRNLWW